MEVKIHIEYGNIEITLVDVWYKENYWTTTSPLLGEKKTGPFRYNKGHRKAVIWDGAGTALLEILDFDFPPYHIIDDRLVKGRAFHNVKNRILRFGDHLWFHRKEETIE